MFIRADQANTCQVLLWNCSSLILLRRTPSFACCRVLIALFQPGVVLCLNMLPFTQYTFPKDVGAAARENTCRAPGPGQYNLPTGVGKQVPSIQQRSMICFLSPSTIPAKEQRKKHATRPLSELVSLHASYRLDGSMLSLQLYYCMRFERVSLLRAKTPTGVYGQTKKRGKPNCRPAVNIERCGR